MPTYDQLIWPTVQALIQLGGSATNREIDAKVVDLKGITEAETSVLHGAGPQTEVEYRLSWSRTYLRLARALENSARGVWAITEYGRTLIESDVPALVRRVGRQYASGRGSNQPEEPPHAESSVAMPESASSETWRDELLVVLQTMPAASFERLCQRVLRESGFTRVQVTGRSGDGGIDGIGVLRVALLSFQVLFQCKRYNGNVGPSVVRDFRGAMVGRTDKGLVLTTGNFTSEAKRESSRDGAPVIELIDGNDLCSLLKNLNLGVTKRLVEEIGVDAAWFATV